METTIYLTRHGLSEHNLRTEVYMGRSPASRLVEQGREQARLLGGRMAADGLRVDHIAASSLPRTMETAALIGQALGITDIESVDAFWELSKGDWEGKMPRRDLPPDIDAALRADPFGFRYPNGESYRDVTARTAPEFDRLVAAHAGAALLLVLHGDVFRALLHHALEIPERKIGDFIVEPCSLTELHRVEGAYVLARFNDCAHLR